MTSDGGGGHRSFLPALTFLVTTLIASGAWVQKNSELQNAQTQLALATDQNRIAQAQASTFEGQLKAKQEELAIARREAIDETAVAIESFQRAIAEAPDQSQRRSLLQSFARKLRDKSVRATPLVSINQPLPSGLAESARVFSDVLAKHPTVIDLNRIDLHAHYWRGAKLNQVQFIGADLRAVDFSRGSLVGANFQGAFMACVDLALTDVTKADMSGADLSYANLRGVNLSTVTGLTRDKLLGVTFDESTRFPDNIAMESQPSPAYVDAATCKAQKLQQVSVPTQADSSPVPPTPSAVTSPSAGPSTGSRAPTTPPSPSQPPP